jgi:hypothetical protein
VEQAGDADAGVLDDVPKKERVDGALDAVGGPGSGGAIGGGQNDGVEEQQQGEAELRAGEHAGIVIEGGECSSGGTLRGHALGIERRDAEGAEAARRSGASFVIALFFSLRLCISAFNLESFGATQGSAGEGTGGTFSQAGGGRRSRRPGFFPCGGTFTRGEEPGASPCRNYRSHRLASTWLTLNKPA